MKNTNLYLNHEQKSEMIKYSVDEYFIDFPFEKFDLEQINSNPDEYSILVVRLDNYFKNRKIPITLDSGINFPEIVIDRKRVIDLKNGTIPICITFSDESYNGYFSWED